MRFSLWTFLLTMMMMMTSTSSTVVGTAPKPTICGSMELRKLSDFSKLRNCSLIVGHVRITLLQIPSGIDVKELRSNVTEITDYLLIYRLNGLLTLELIFPRLRVIRGHELLYDRYSLAVYENRNLRELGLVELLRIQRGHIRIESNPQLCFLETVNWVYMLGNSTAQDINIKKNKSPNHCPVCGGLSADYSYRQNASTYCWSLSAAQLQPTPPRTRDCDESCGYSGCDTDGTCCQRSCITGCSASSCELCGNYIKDGRCTDHCITSYRLHKRQCISQKECRQLGLIPLAGGYECVARCPGNQRPVQDPSGIVHCQVECNGLFHIKRGSDLEQLEDCVTINGSLIIELEDIKEKIVSELERSLSSLKEITGYLKVLRSAQLLSLHFLKNLDTIRGDQLIENRYALYVVDNHHLEQIWPPSRQIAIQRGTIFFHLNPRLCYEKVLQLESSLKGSYKITIADVSPNSNGERVICGDSVRNLTVTVEDKNATAVRIAVNFMSWEDMETLIGYSYHYMEAPQENVNMYDGRHGCGHDNWLMDVSPTKNRRHVISGLKPFTQYAFFVKTITRTDYHMQIDAYSPITYFTTQPKRANPAARLYGSSQRSAQILLQWWPPRRPNGRIIKYLVSYELANTTKLVEEPQKVYGEANYSECECNDLIPYNSGPQPEDEDYYSKEQITYEDALPNLIYVSRHRDPSKKDKFKKVKSFEDLVTPPVIPTITTDPPATINEPKISGNATKTSQRDIKMNETSSRPKNIFDLEAAAEVYEKYRQQVEQRLRLAQDTGIEDFLIIQPLPACSENKKSSSSPCTKIEKVEGQEVPGNRHYYIINDLEPEQIYRCRVRACVADVLNGCSSPLETLVKTISSDVDELMWGNSDQNRFDDEKRS